MTFSPAKARRFIAVLDDIIERIGLAPQDFSEHRMSAMFAELNSLADAIGVGRFELPIAELRFHSLDDKPDIIKEGWSNPSPRPKAHLNGVSLIYRERYNLNKHQIIWALTTIQDGVLRGLPTRKYFATQADFAEFGAALREWKRWAQGQLDEHERQPENATRAEAATTADAATSTTDMAKRPAEQSKPDARLKPCESNAYLLFQYAEEKTERVLEDREALNWLKNNDWPEGLFPGASVYKLPSFVAWTRYLSAARNAHGTPKRRRRDPVIATRSIARQRDLDSPRGD